MTATCANNTKDKPITLKDLADYSYEMEDKKTSLFDFPKVSGFTRLMNKMGWYREPTVYVIDSSKFKLFATHTQRGTHNETFRCG